MVRFLFYFFLSCGVFVPLNLLWGQWESELYDHLNSYRDVFEDDEYPWLGTIKAIADVKNTSHRKVRRELHSFQSNFFEKTLPFTFAPVRDKKGVVLPSKLVVYVPSIFTDHTVDDGVIEIFHRQGYHVLILPTGFSVPYTKAQPVFKPGDFTAEAHVVLFLTRTVLKKLLGVEKIKKGMVHYIGLSYGATMGGHVAMANKGAQFVFSSFSFFSPIFNLQYALDVYDELLLLEGVQRKPLKTLSTALNLVNAKDPASIRKKSKQDIERFLHWGFKKRVQSLLNRVEKIKKTPPLEEPSKGASFERYVTEHAPDLRVLFEGPLGDFDYILSRARAHQNSRIRVLVTKNDPLNPVDGWKDFEDSSFVLEDGGHLNYKVGDWMKTLLEKLSRLL